MHVVVGAIATKSVEGQRGRPLERVDSRRANGEERLRRVVLRVDRSSISAQFSVKSAHCGKCVRKDAPGTRSKRISQHAGTFLRDSTQIQRYGSYELGNVLIKLILCVHDNKHIYHSIHTTCTLYSLYRGTAPYHTWTCPYFEYMRSCVSMDILCTARSLYFYIKRINTRSYVQRICCVRYSAPARGWWRCSAATLPGTRLWRRAARSMGTRCTRRRTARLSTCTRST